MKKFIIVTTFLSSLFLFGCGQKTMSEADMAQKYNLSIEEFREQKQAAARMNMSVEDHLGGGMTHE